MIGDVSGGEIARVPFKEFKIEAIWQKPNQTIPLRSEIFAYDWEPWELQAYTPRLKQSYFILKDYFKTLD